jgi:hypothetical protein
MNNFNDWNDVLAMKGLREAVMAYAKAEAPEYLEERADGVKGLSDDDYPYVLERAIKEKGECVFYFSRGADDQIQDHAHYRFVGKYFECDGAGQIGGPCDDNNADIILDLLSDAYEAGFVASPAPGATVSVGGDFPDEYFVKLCSNLIPVGQQIEINCTLYVRTTEGLASVKLP